MFEEKIKKATEKLNKLIEERSALLTQADEKANADKIHEIRTKLSEKNEKIKNTKSEIEDYKALAEQEKRTIDLPKENKEVKKVNTRDAINKYIHTRDASDAAQVGLKTDDNQVIIPKDLQYKPEKVPETVVDLSKLALEYKAPAGAGTYPLIKRVNAVLNTTEELQKTPALQKPEFLDVDYKVKTYRGAIPVSQEDIQDTQADLLGIVAQQAQEQKLNTVNAKITEALSSFDKVTATGVDDIKKILNVTLDPAYRKVIVASQSFYNYLDTLKDKNGRYLLNEPIKDGNATTFLGVNVVVVSDKIFGDDKGTKAHAFIGDPQRAVLYANRADMSLRWYDEIAYGTYLGVATRFDVVKADKDAGKFVEVDTSTPATSAVPK